MMQEHIFERLAREKGITVEEMRAIISARIEKGWNDEDPVKREQWRKIPCARRNANARRMAAVCGRENQF